MSECLLVIVVTPAMEEEMVDWLLQQDSLSGFSSMAVNGHGTSHTQLSAAEQVAGRQRKMMFHVHGEETLLRELLDDLKGRFSASGIHYWLMPLLAGGHL